MMFCRIYQWRIEKELDDYGQIRHLRTLRHLEVCPSCQGWLQSLKQIGRHLQMDSSGVSDSHMKQVQATVHQHLSDATAGHIATTSYKIYSYKTYKFYHFRYAIGAIAAVIVIAIGLFGLYSLESDNHNYNHNRNHNYNKMVDSVAQLPGQLQYQIPALVNIPEQMLESEMQNMETSVRHAIRFVQNCLPQGLVSSNPSSENIDSL